MDMVPLIILLGLALVPLLAALVLRSNGAVAFLSVCLGSILSSVVAPDVSDFVTGFTPVNSAELTDWTRAVLVVLPVLIGLLVTRKSVSASKQVMNFVPALAAGLLLALFVVPVLPVGPKDLMTSTEYWDTISNLETIILLVGAAASYGLFLFSGSHHKADEKKHK
jgi:amino acid transporter